MTNHSLSVIRAVQAICAEHDWQQPYLYDRVHTQHGYDIIAYFASERGFCTAVYQTELRRLRGKRPREAGLALECALDAVAVTCEVSGRVAYFARHGGDEHCPF